MRYPYICGCGNEFEVIKSVRQIDDPEMCDQCGCQGIRVIARQQSFYGAGDWDKTAYCPALGQVVKSDAHRRKLAAQRGWDEVGTEDLTKVAADNDRRIEAEREKGYDEAARLAYNHGFNQ